MCQTFGLFICSQMFIFILFGDEGSSTNSEPEESSQRVDRESGFPNMFHSLLKSAKRNATDGKQSATDPWHIQMFHSRGLLCYFTSDAMQESWETVLVCQGKASADGDEEVNGWITLGFALGGVAFDVMCLIQFYKSNKKTSIVSMPFADFPASFSADPAPFLEFQSFSPFLRRTGSGRSVNIFSAFLHVSADFLRSSATLVMSLIILFGQVDSTCIDAYSSIFIGVTIVVGAFVGFFKWLKPTCFTLLLQG